MTVQEQPAGSVALETQAGEAVMQALLQMQPINLGGVAQGMLWLTPSDVQRVPELRKGPHWEFTLTPLDTAKQVAPHNHGVYLDGGQFPPVCADCGSPATRVGLLEVGLPVQSLSSKLRVSTKADAQKVFQALRDIGRTRVSDEDVKRLRQILPEKDRKSLLRSVRFAPIWMQAVLEAIAEG